MRTGIIMCVALLMVMAATLQGVAASNSGAHEKVSVVVSLPVLKSIVEDIGGVYVEVKVVLPEGGEPHLFQVTPQIIEDVESADVIVFTGHFEFEAEIMEAARGKIVLTLGPDGYYGGYKVRILGLPGSGMNLHGYWLLPENGRSIASAVADALSRVDPEHEEYYQENLRLFLSRLEEVERGYLEVSREAGFKGGDAVVAFPAEQYIAHALGADVVGVISLGHGLSPSGSTLVDLENTLRNAKRPIIIVSDLAWTLNLGPLVEELASRTGATVVRVRVMSGGLGYLELLSYNLGSARASVDAAIQAVGGSDAGGPLLILVGVLATIALLEGVLLVRAWR